MKKCVQNAEGYICTEPEQKDADLHFVVTRREPGHEMFLGIPVHEFEEVTTDETTGIIITVGLEFCDEIEKTVRKKEGIRYYVPVREDV